MDFLPLPSMRRVSQWDELCDQVLVPSMRRVSQWDELCDQVLEHMDTAGHDEALVSMVFANPRSVVFADLESNFAYLDLRSGRTWDLFFVGYGGRYWGKFPRSDKTRRSTDFWSHAQFYHTARDVSEAHRAALASADDVPPNLEGWRYSGNCDLVSLMAYRRGSHDILWDWPSLRAVMLTDANGSYVEQGLGEVVETLSEWRAEPADLDQLAPGEGPVVTRVLDLGRALAAVGTAAGSGVAGGAAYDLLKGLF